MKKIFIPGFFDRLIREKLEYLSIRKKLYLGFSTILTFMIIIVIVGVIGCVGAWMIGPSRGLLVAAQDGCIPSFLQKTNRKHMPTFILLIQGIIFSLSTENTTL